MRKLTAVMMVLFFLLVFTPIVNAQGIGLMLDSKKVVFTESTGSPFIDANARTLVPFRVVLEQFGCTVQWKAKEQVAEARKNGTVVQVPIGKAYIFVNGVKKTNDTAAQVKDGRTFLPIRAVLEAFGASVSWNQAAQAVVVTSAGIKSTGAGVQRVRGEIESDQYPLITLKKGQPAQVNFHAEAQNLNGCNNALVIPDFNIEKDLVPGDNIVEFTPTKTGTYGYTCWMGMVSGQIKVIE